MNADFAKTGAAAKIVLLQGLNAVAPHAKLDQVKSQGESLSLGCKVNQGGALHHLIAHRGLKVADNAIEGRAEGVLHLHGLQHDKDVAASDRLTLSDQDGDDSAGHG